MRQFFFALCIILAAISLVATAFTINQVGNEEKRLKSSLEQRTNLLTESLKESVEPNFINKSDAYLQTIVEKFAGEERFAGLAVYDNKESVVAISSALSKDIFQRPEVVINSMDQDSPVGSFIPIDGKLMYLFANPLHDGNTVLGALLVVQNASYIDAQLTEIWKTNLLRLLIQVFLLSIASILIIRWILYAPIRNLAESIRLIRTSNIDEDLERISKSPFYSPLVNEVIKIKKSLTEARLNASEEARLNLERIDATWTSQRLSEFVKDIAQNKAIFIISNREPYIHSRENGKLHFYQPASGMITALEPMAQAAHATWIAFGSGNADKETVNEKNIIMVPPDEPSYDLHRVWLNVEEEQRYYYGFSNEGLWPLCHNAHTRPIFRKEDWEQYKKVNTIFAHEILKEIKYLERPIILVQDFHLALIPRLIKSKRSGSAIELFWHIPWPNHEAFSICPWKKEILDGMLGADIIGFQTQLHCNNFIETVSKELEARIDLELFSITRNNHTTYIRPFPVSVAQPNDEPQNILRMPQNRRDFEKKFDIHTQYIGIGVDRLDYTKGILERLKAVEIFLRTYPIYQGKFTFVQIAAPTREKIDRYKTFSSEVQEEIDRINNSFKTKDWKPIVYSYKHYDRSSINSFYQAADLCLVTSLHDGMNLVAKEFVASRIDMQGVLILSQFTGAARELKDALIINPYDGQETAEAIKNALEMSQHEQKKRMYRMRETIKNYNIYRWSAELLKAVTNVSKPL